MNRNAGPAPIEHLGQKFLGERKDVALREIAWPEKPTGKPRKPRLFREIVGGNKIDLKLLVAIQGLLNRERKTERQLFQSFG